MSDKLSFPPDAVDAWSRLRDAARGLQWVCVDALASPTPEQVKAIQSMFPADNLLAIRRRLVAGEVRIGPVDPANIEAYATAALAGTGLAWHAAASTDAELDAMGLGPLE